MRCANPGDPPSNTANRLTAKPTASASPYKFKSAIWCVSFLRDPNNLVFCRIANHDSAPAVYTQEVSFRTRIHKRKLL
jgi:hypothetical protein